MCDIVGQAVRAGVSRRNVLRATLGEAALGVAACTGTRVRPRTSPRPAALPPRPVRRRRGDPDAARPAGHVRGPAVLAGLGPGGHRLRALAGDRYYVVDTGAGLLRQMRRAQLGNWQHDTDGPLDAMRAIFLTHLHSDHVVDLNNLLTEGLYNGLAQVDRKVQIWGPGNRGALPPLFGAPPAPQPVAPESPTPGTKEMVDLLVRAFATDFNDRAFDNRKPVPTQVFEGLDVPIPAQYLADPNGTPAPRMSPVKFYEDDRVRVSATLVQHAPVFPALGLRFDTDDGSVAFSGDTGPTDNVVELAQGADVLVHEVIARGWPERLLPPRATTRRRGCSST